MYDIGSVTVAGFVISGQGQIKISRGPKLW